MPQKPRITVPVAAVLAALLAEPDAERYGLDLIGQTGLPSGTLYPLLTRLQQAGWVEASWEQIDPAAAGRPARRYYRLTPTGVQAATESLAEVRARMDLTRPRTRRSTGQATAPSPSPSPSPAPATRSGATGPSGIGPAIGVAW